MRRRKYSSSISLLRGEATPAEVSGSLVLFVKRKAGSIFSLLVGVLVGLILAQALSGGGVSYYHLRNPTLATSKPCQNLHHLGGELTLPLGLVGRIRLHRHGREDRS